MKLLVAAILAPALFASTTATWEVNSYYEFLKGRFTGVALSRDGRLSLAPRMENLFSPDQPQIWSMAKTADGVVYLGTGHRGRVYRLDQTGKGSLVWASEQAEVFALAVDPKGVLYAGTSPDGKIYRIENGKASEVFNPGAKYIWALVFAPDGTLYAGTGDQGKIFRITPNGAGTVYYESGQSHITALAVDADGKLLAGSEPNGIVYRLSGPGKAFVLYDANLPEIRTLLPSTGGVIYVAALGGSVAKRTGSTSGASSTSGATVTAPPTSITVTDSQAQSGPEVKPPKNEAPRQQTPTPQPVIQTAISTVEVTGVEKSAIYRIRPDNTVETIWSSKDENVYDLNAMDGRLVFSTDVQGRIYRLGPDRKAALIAQTNEGETTRLLDTPAGLLAATGDMGKIYRLSQTSELSGSFESPVHDSGTVARWGRLSWRAGIPQGARLAFRTRAGNSARPDNTWSDWSDALVDPASAPIPSPNARYLQWRVEMSGPATLDSVTAAYLPQNTPPLVRSISVNPIASAQKTGAASPSSSANSAFSVTVTDTGDAAPQTSSGNPTQTISRGGAQQTQISWQAEDPDGDRLVYAIYFRGEDEQEWKLLRSNYSENTLAIDSDVLADGRYTFRVVASDRPSNAASSAREGELVSPPVLIDNTPPVVTASSPRRANGIVDIDIDAVDQTSALRRCEYAVDAGPWLPIEAIDGVTDSPREKFALHIENLRAGEHVVVVRVYDAANNAGLTKIVVR